MLFQVGDRVVHSVHGLGQIVKLEERALSGQSAFYYVVQIRDLQVWVPVQADTHSSIRPPTPTVEYERLFAILSSPGEPLPVDRMERKRLLVDRLKDGTLESVCRVIRDLHLYVRTKKTSDYDAMMLERAEAFLVSEWTASMSIPPAQAERELKRLLEISQG